MKSLAFVAALCLASLPSSAQHSASFRIEELALNAGGHPIQGMVLSSPSFRITTDSLGEAAAPGAAGPSFRVDGGFVAFFVPPGEVQDVRASGKTELEWTPERSAGSYNVYRGEVLALPASFGECQLAHLPGPAATDRSYPGAGTAWLYLVTVENRLREEGVKGFSSDGSLRPNPDPCP